MHQLKRPLTTVFCALMFLGAATVHRASAQAIPGTPFEVTSVKMNTGCQDAPVAQQALHPGRLQLACMTLQAMIQFAYGTFANGVSRSPEAIRILDLPDWGMAERFAVDAKAELGTRVEMMAGPMLQMLLEDRFKLRVHHESKEAPVYGLTLGKNGAKLRQTKEGSCVQLDPSHRPQPGPGEAAPHICGDRSVHRAADGSLSIDFYGMSLAGVCRFLGQVVDTPVIDKTGLQGSFDFHLDFSVEESDTSPNIFAAVEQQLGLKLVSQKGPLDFLVIDHVEKPTLN
jgi:uncharacterized protein (TIGR03435 family)